MLRGRFFSFIKSIFRELSPFSRSCATSTTGVGFYFAAAITSNAQDQLHHYVRAENGDFRDGGKPEAVAADSAALSLYPLPRTKPESKRRGNGRDALRHSHFLDFGT